MISKRPWQSGKRSGISNISGELNKVGAMIPVLRAVLATVWYSNNVPSGGKKGLVVSIRNRKGNHYYCDNYRGITLLSIPGKVLAVGVDPQSSAKSPEI